MRDGTEVGIESSAEFQRAEKIELSKSQMKNTM